jgi:long-chain acyl-CoA synthetase
MHARTDDPARGEEALRLISDIPGQSAARYGQRTAYTVVMPNGMYGSLTYAEVDELSDDFACYLRETLGLRLGDRVALQTPNCLTFPVAAFGILKAGCVLVNTNPLYTGEEMGKQFVDAEVGAVVIVDMFADKLPEAMRDRKIPHVVVSAVSERMPSAVAGVIRLVQRYWDRTLPDIQTPHARFAAALAEGAKARRERGIRVSDYTAECGPETLACLQYTGGTTGVAKGAMLSHGNIIANIRQAESSFGGLMERGEEVILTAIPLYHILAFTANFLLFHRWGGANVLIPNPRPISNLKRAFENHRITWMTGVNTLFNALSNEFWFADSPPKTLKGAVAGGMALQAAVAERFRTITGVEVFEGYGLTETSPIVTFNTPGRARQGTIGLPMPETEVQVLDADGRPVPPGEPGELAVRGPQVMQGYWRKPDETAKAMLGGWFLTGDIATRDADGYLRIVDRKKDMVLVSGFNVYPNEVEDVLARHPGVLETAVIGLPDGASGEAVAAYVVPRDPGLTPEALKEHCRAHMTGYKVPRTVTFRESLPKSNVGKILRKDLRAEVLGQAAGKGV